MGINEPELIYTFDFAFNFHGFKHFKKCIGPPVLYIVLNIIVSYRFSVSCNHHLTLEPYFKYFDFLSRIECKRD